MGDIANMTDYGGYVNGFRLLRWLRSRAEKEIADAAASTELGCPRWAAVLRSRANLLTEMADDLEAELTPPDYPEDDGDELPSYMHGPHDPDKRSPGADDEGVDLDGMGGLSDTREE